MNELNKIHRSQKHQVLGILYKEYVAAKAMTWQNHLLNFVFHFIFGCLISWRMYTRKFCALISDFCDGGFISRNFHMVSNIVHSKPIPQYIAGQRLPTRGTFAQAPNQFGKPGGAKSFLRGAQKFELCPTHSSRGEENFCRGFCPSCAPHGYGPAFAYLKE